MTVTPTMVNKAIGMSSPGIRTDCLRGVDTSCWQRKSDLRTASNGAGCVHGSIVGEHRLPRDGEPEPGPARLARHVRFPDSRQAIRRNSAARVPDRDDDATVTVLTIASDRHTDA